MFAWRGAGLPPPPLPCPSPAPSGSGVVSFAVNGVPEPGLSCSLGPLALGAWLTPALSLHSDFTAVVNLGASGPFAHAVPSFEAVAGAVRL